MYSFMLLGVFAATALGKAITFGNTTFTEPAIVGSTWPISFSKGNGKDVAIVFGNSTYGFQVVDGLTAPGMYSWKVAVPVNVVAGTYQLALVQQGADTVYSPSFSLEIPADQVSSTTDAPTTDLPFPTAGETTVVTTATTTQTTIVTAIFLPGPTGLTPMMMNGTMNGTTPAVVTYIYWEESCSCHHTSTCDYTAMPTTPMSTTTVAYSAEDCGCTKTIEAPCAVTAIPVAPTAAPVPAPAPAAATPATNMPVATAAATAAPAMPTTAAPAPFTGGAKKLVGSGLGFLALVAALVMA